MGSTKGSFDWACGGQRRRLRTPGGNEGGPAALPSFRGPPNDAADVSEDCEWDVTVTGFFTAMKDAFCVGYALARLTLLSLPQSGFQKVEFCRHLSMAREVVFAPAWRVRRLLAPSGYPGFDVLPPWSSTTFAEGLG